MDDVSLTLSKAASPWLLVHSFPLLWASHPLSGLSSRTQGDFQHGQVAPDHVELLCESVEDESPFTTLSWMPDTAGSPASRI